MRILFEVSLVSFLTTVRMKPEPPWWQFKGKQERKVGMRNLVMAGQIEAHGNGIRRRERS